MTSFRLNKRSQSSSAPKTIILVHSLENDFKSLKILHSRVIDTSEIYPHHEGTPAELSSSMLAYKALTEKMNRDNGQDSCDDARMTLRLVQKKLLSGAKYLPVLMSVIRLKCLT